MGKRILLADDSVTIHKVVELTFLDEDYEIEVASSGDEAIAKLADEAPDLVITDVHMPPGPSGYEVCDKVREVHPGVPVLLLAGAFEAFDEERAAAADAYLKKPFDSQRLLQTVQDLMGEGGGSEESGESGEEESREAAGEAPEPETEEGAAEEAESSTPGGDEGEQVAVEESFPEEAVPAPEVEAPAEKTLGGGGDLSPADVDAIARRVVELLGDEVVREVAWEVVPDLAEVVVKDRLRELEEPAD
jgi:CheY-like chemotaxis protein